MENIKKRYILLILFISGLIIIPLFFLRDFTPRNELKYINIASAMADNGKFFTLYDNGTIYTDKPPFFFWIINLVKYIFGSYNLGFVGTIVAFIPALAILIMAMKFTANYIGQRFILVTPLILLTTPLFFISASCIRMDMLMCMFITGSLVLFFLMYDGKVKLCRKNSYFIFLLIGSGVYIKGVAGILVPLMTITIFLILEKNISFFKKIHILEGFVILILMILAWFAPAVYFNGTEYLNQMFVKQTLERGVNAFTHKRPFYYYITSLFPLYFQWSILIFVIIIKYTKKNLVIEKYEKFMFIWFASTIIFFSIVSSKLWIYILPIVFPVSLLMVKYIKSAIDEKKRILRNSVFFFSTLFLLAGITLIVLTTKQYSGVAIKDFIFTAIAFISLSVSAILLYKKNKLKSIFLSSVIPFIILVINITFVLPKYNELLGLKEVCKKIEVFGNKNVISYQFSSGVYAKYYLGQSIPYTANKLEVNNILDKEKKIILLMETKDFKKLDSSWIINTIYKGSTYSAFEISK